MPPTADTPAGWSALRATVVSELLADAIAPLGPGLQIVDAGGGTGGVAVPLAAAGHDVLVVDTSPDAMATLRRRAGDLAGDRLRAVQGDLAELAELVPPSSVDVVVVHDVLEVVDDPDAALRAVHHVLRPGGVASVLVVNRGGVTLARALSGRFAEATALLEGPSETGPRYDVRTLSTALESAGFAVDAVHGIRVFSDLVPGALLEGDQAAVRALVALERAAAGRADLLAVAARLHAIARRP